MNSFFIYNMKNNVLWKVNTHLTIIPQVVSFKRIIPKMLHKSHGIMGSWDLSISISVTYTVPMISWDSGQKNFKKYWSESSNLGDIIWIFVMKLKNLSLKKTNMSKLLDFVAHKHRLPQHYSIDQSLLEDTEVNWFDVDHIEPALLFWRLQTRLTSYCQLHH